MTSSILSAPIRAGGASPLRVATGGNASSGSKARCRRSPARTNRRRDERCGWPQEPSPLRGFEGFATGRAALTYIGHLFMTKPRASLRSETCPISIGIGVRYGLEQVSELIGMRKTRLNPLIFFPQQQTARVFIFLISDFNFLLSDFALRELQLLALLSLSCTC